MPERTAILCTNCEQVYAARKRDDGSFILPTSDAACGCGTGDFTELDEREVTSD